MRFMRILISILGQANTPTTDRMKSLYDTDGYDTDGYFDVLIKDAEFYPQNHGGRG